MTAALDALARLDDGLPVSAADRRMLGVFDAHCAWDARPCLICGAEVGGPECLTCVIRADVAAVRAEDR